MSDREARLAGSLTALAPAGGGDWADVVARSGTIRTARHHRRIVLALAITTLLIGAGATFAVGTQYFDWFHVSTPPGWFSVETSKSKAPATKGTLAYIAGRTLFQPHKRPQRLAYPLRPVFRNDSLAVSSPDGRYVVYQTTRIYSREHVVFTPSLYVHDTVASREKLIARGTMSSAWSRDGRIAYFKADHERYDGRTPYVGQVMVQTLEGAPAAWTRQAAPYSVLAWARDELLVRVEWCLDPDCPRSPRPGTVYALTRGGQLRNLHLETVLALSPDGRYALGPAYVEFENYSPLVRIVRIDSGKTVATLNAKRLFRRALPGLKLSWEYVNLDSASWSGGEIAASFIAGSHSLLAVFRLRGQRLVLESAFRVPASRLPKTKYGAVFHVPYFVGPANERIVVTVSGAGTERSDQGGFLGVLVCSRATRNCVLGQTFSYASLGSSGSVDVVRNLSRPLAPTG